MKREALLTAALSLALSAGCKDPKKDAPTAPATSAAPPIATTRATTSAAPAAPSVSHAATPACPKDDWPTYGHDPARTGASKGGLPRALRVLSTTKPPDVPPRAAAAQHAIVHEGVVFASGVTGKSPSAWRLGEKGEIAWRFDSRADIQRSTWLCAAMGSVVLNDDGFYLLHPETGKNRFDRGLDTWGQTLATRDHFFLVNTWHVEGPGTFVGAFTEEGKTLWKANRYGSVKEDVMDDGGAIALTDKTLFHAANYKFAPHGGLSALDVDDKGKRRWFVNTFPISDVSTDGELVYEVEKPTRKDEPELVARKVATGEPAWKAPAKAAMHGAPVVFDGGVFVDRGGEIARLSAKDGAVVWSKTVAGKRAAEALPSGTVIAASACEKKLVVTAGDKVLVLSAESGEVVSELEVPEAHSPAVGGGRVVVVSKGAVVVLGE